MLSLESTSELLQRLTVGQRGTLACIMEATAPKAGNVFPGQSFRDLAYEDFVAAALAIGPALESAGREPLGRVILQAVTASRRVTRSNANLGMILLLCPLTAAEYTGQPLRKGLATVLDKLTASDTADVYAAILAAQPGGMGKVAEHDLAQSPPDNLLTAMRAAQDRDRIAKCYCDGFSDIFDTVVPILQEQWQLYSDWHTAIRWSQIKLLSIMPDTLIERKCGRAMAIEVQQKAQQVDRFEGDELARLRLWQEFDAFLRADGHRRNPGTTADLIAAGLFVVFSTNELSDNTSSQH